MEERDAAVSVLRRSFPRLDLAPDDDGVFALRHSGAAEGRWSVQSLHVRGYACMTGSVVDPYAVGRVTGGSAALRYGDHEVDVERPYLRTVGHSELRVADAALEMVTLEPSAFERSAHRYLAGTGLRLIPPSGERTQPLTPAGGALWVAAQRYARLVAGDPDLAQNDLILDQVHDLLVRTFLAVFPVTSRKSPGAESTSAVTPRSIRRALDHVEAHLAESMTVADLAAVAGCSVRALQAGFRRHTGGTAMGYLRDRRLDAARAELLLVEPATATVASVAQKWGFAHPSRFSRDYMSRFGEYPRDTLRT